MATSTTTTVALWLIRSTDKAHLFSTAAQHRVDADTRQIWIPRSVIKSLVKFGNSIPDDCDPGEWRECEATIEDWWTRKEGLA